MPSGENHLGEMARDVVRRALAAGAGDAECTIEEGDEFSANVRMRELENLKEAGSRAAGLRILIGKRTGSSYTSDLSAAGLELLVKSAIELAEVTTDDPHAGLPEPEELGALSGGLDLYSADVDGLETDGRIDLARRAEEAALAADPRITNSEGASFDSYAGRHIFANSRGFAGEYRTSSCSLVVVPVARDGESMERDAWHHSARSLARLEPPEQIGRTAAARALRRLHPVKVATQKVPVVFEPRVAASLVENLFEAVHGMMIYRHESFLAGKLGQKVASEKLSLIDDATMPGLFGTSPFDDEGVASRRTVVLERGVLKSYLLNTYAARKLGMKTTGNASRGLAGNAGIGHGNFFVENGVLPPERIIAGIADGFYVTELIGMGVNTVTGDYSRGAAGFWVENGALQYPVAEITIAGNLRDMLKGIAAVGDDVDVRGGTRVGSILLQEMTIAGD